MFALGAAAATVGAVQLGIVARWIATGKGPGVAALITFLSIAAAQTEALLLASNARVLPNRTARCV